MYIYIYRYILYGSSPPCLQAPSPDILDHVAAQVSKD